MLEKIRKFFQGPPGLMGPQGSVDHRPYMAFTHCNMCANLRECTRIGNHLICHPCEIKMFNRIRLILKFE